MFMSTNCLSSMLRLSSAAYPFPTPICKLLCAKKMQSTCFGWLYRWTAGHGLTKRNSDEQLNAVQKTDMNVWGLVFDNPPTPHIHTHKGLGWVFYIHFIMQFWDSHNIVTVLYSYFLAFKICLPLTPFFYIKNSPASMLPFPFDITISSIMVILD